MGETRPRLAAWTQPSRLASLAVLIAVVVAIWAGVSIWRGQRIHMHMGDEDRLSHQIEERLGPRAEVRLLERGQGGVLCGYVAHRGARDDQAFISQPNRLLLERDPLPQEFERLRRAYCPGLIRPLPPVA
ncbi:hypothetical protein Q0812_09050 [Brevundimonas sp. 2R-24]|uniref:Uncharacterized protein n=1 Tax=Peiella sedimenti TaxID=3061083 RepID=A0ABT8SLY1_9CAUL|nr:hypothetical protein [Caulobacteraceae bacterium XZ-24]